MTIQPLLIEKIGCQRALIKPYSPIFYLSSQAGNSKKKLDLGRSSGKE